MGVDIQKDEAFMEEKYMSIKGFVPKINLLLCLFFHECFEVGFYVEKYSIFYIRGEKQRVP